MSSIQLIPPKSLQQLAERARNGEGFRVTETIFKFAAGSIVSVVFDLNSKNGPSGHCYKDAAEAAEIKKAIAAKKEQQK